MTEKHSPECRRSKAETSCFISQIGCNAIKGRKVLELVL